MAANNFLFANVYQISATGAKNATTGQVANVLQPGKQPTAKAFPIGTIVSISEVAPGTLPGLPYIYGKITAAGNAASTPTQEFYTAETVLALAARGNA